MDIKLYSNDELTKLFSNYLYYYDQIAKQKRIVEAIQNQKSQKYSEEVDFYNRLNEDIKPFTDEIRYIFENPSKIRIVQVPLSSILREQYQIDKENIGLENKVKNLESIFSQTIRNFRVQDEIPLEYSARELENQITIHENIVQDLEETYTTLLGMKDKKKKKSKKKKKEPSFEDRIFNMIGL